MSKQRTVQCSTCKFSDWYEYTSMACKNCYAFNLWLKKEKQCQKITPNNPQEKESPVTGVPLKVNKL